MAIKPIKLPDFLGGLNLKEPTLIEDNQMSLATNYSYDENKLPRTRLGYTNKGSAMSSTVIVLHNMDTFNGNGTWVGADDATTVATEASNQRVGAGAVSFNIDVSNSGNDYASINNSSTPMTGVDLSSASDTGAIRMLLNFPDAVTNITNVRLRWGSDASNYFEQTVTTQFGGTAFAQGWNYLSFDWATATETGTVVDTAIDTLDIRITYGSGQADMTGVLIDHITYHSADVSSAVLSIFEYFESDGTQHVIAHCNTSLYELNLSIEEWEHRYVGATAAKGTYTVFKDVMYYVNGTDFIDYDGVTMQERAGAPRLKAMVLFNDRGYGITDDSDIHYTGGNPSDLLPATFASNDPINPDDGEKNMGLIRLGNLIYVAKEKSTYEYDVTGPSYQAIDNRRGTPTHHSIVQVENEAYMMADDSEIYRIFVLQQASARTRAESLTEDLTPLTNTFKNTSTVDGYYWKRTNNVYFAVDEDNSGANTAIMVYNVLVGAWTKWVGINVNDFTTYTDSNSNERLIAASSFGGQVIEIENGLTDDTVGIQSEFQTKLFDFAEPTLEKEVREIDLFFLATDGAQFDVSYITERGVEATETVDVGALDTETTALATDPLGTQRLGGAPADTFVSVRVRFPVYAEPSVTGQVKIDNVLSGHAVLIKKIQIVPNPKPFDFFPSSNIL